MAGILDFLQSPDAQLGIGLLAAGGPTTDPNQTGFGQRLAGAMNSVTANQQIALRAKLMQSQIDENAVQNKLREAQIAQQGRLQDAIGGFFGGGAPAGGGAAPGVPGGSPGAAPVAGGAAPGGMQLRGMPIESIARLKAMGGPDLMDAWKAANVPTQFSAGSYAYTPGGPAEYLPDPTKGVAFKGGQVSMLPGSENLATLAGQTSAAQNASKTVKVWNPTTQRYDYTNETNAAGGGFAADPSAKETATNDAQRARAVSTANADVVRDTTKQGAAKLAGQMGAGVDRALELLKQGPTASGAGSMVDSTANFFGKSTKGADLASQLDTISGWLTSNVPRMEGPQSDKDVANYRIMAAAVGDRTKPVSQRVAAAEELKGLQAKYADLNGIKPEGSWGDSAPAKPPAGEQPKSAFVNVGGKQVPAKRAPDGNLYVMQPNGKYAKVVE
jgi:hypothetical protein